ncbi:hypothetical protein PR001_g12180 [Phytophthora rubi]|uniref:Uncharacterized protein n=1 Tax=Phytophthora rubi TaxID=129364 RepID=A0A6A3M4D5_9STRA|nr:hypothetical protein PR002_g12540 [Phytophthora rubi]KAE9026506.1 hypothetical protein PR001_g12180 [Phytophthora rubi]
MFRRPTRLPSRSQSAATARAFRSLGCTERSGRPRRGLETSTASACRGIFVDTPATASSRRDDTLPGISTPSVKHPAAPGSPGQRRERTQDTPLAEAPGGSPYRSPPTSPLPVNPPPSPTPAPSATLATRGASVEGVTARAAVATPAASATEPPAVVLTASERQFYRLAELVVSVARAPPTRVGPMLDRRLEHATTLKEVAAAAIAPRRLPVAESEEMMSLRQEVDRLQTLATDTEDKLRVELELRVKSDFSCVQTSTELHEAQDRLDERGGRSSSGWPKRKLPWSRTMR